MVAAASRSSSRKSVAVRHSNSEVEASRIVRWDKKMSNNCAFALLVYTMLQIFFVISFIETKGMSIAPYFGLVVLVALIIPFCRNFEKRWENIAQSNLSEQSMAARFRKDQIVLWVLAIGLPVLFVGLITAAGALF